MRVSYVGSEDCKINFARDFLELIENQNLVIDIFSPDFFLNCEIEENYYSLGAVEAVVKSLSMATESNSEI